MNRKPRNQAAIDNWGYVYFKVLWSQIIYYMFQAFNTVIKEEA